MWTSSFMLPLTSLLLSHQFLAFFFILSKVCQISCLPATLSASPIDLSLLPVHCSVSSPKLLLISLDGFRYDYLDIARSRGVNVSGFEKIQKSGIRALRLENEFVTNTGPNHFSIVTGLHEESHGLVDNVYLDPDLGVFALHNSTQATESKWFDVGGEPIWVTNQRHGHSSGVTFWPGSHAKIKNYVPTYHYDQYNAGLPLRQSIVQAMNWLCKSEVTLVLIYHPQPDIKGHAFGPASSQVMDLIGAINEDIEFLLDQVNRWPDLKRSLNLIITSDHGMSEVTPKRTILLDRFISSTMFDSPGKDIRVLWHLWPKPGFTPKDLYNALLKQHPNMTVHMKSDIPKHFFYSNNRRIAPVVVYADPGWMIARSNSSVQNMSRKGDHGYDPQMREMSPIFMARGPGFVRLADPASVPTIKLIDLYPMMCHLLRLHNPAPHNGSFARIAHLLQLSPYDMQFGSFQDKFTVLLLFAVLNIVATVIICCACCVHWHMRRMPFHVLRRRRKAAAECAMALNRLNSMPSKHTHTNNSNDCHSSVDADDTQCLIGLSTSDAFVHLNKNPDADQFSVDDHTLLKMLRDPKSRFP